MSPGARGEGRVRGRGVTANGLRQPGQVRLFELEYSSMKEAGREQSKANRQGRGITEGINSL